MKRSFGMLLPVSALPSKEGIGTLGKEARSFVNYLKTAGACIWQTLPLVPTGYGDSPYQACSANALNYYFIDLEILVERGLLEAEEVRKTRLFDEKRRVHYGLQFENKIPLLRLAYSRFFKTEAFQAFVEKGEYADFALFMSLKTKFGHRPWTEWAEPYRIYDEKTVGEFLRKNEEEYLFWQFTQFEFLSQWRALKAYANERGVRIMGDIPLYLSYDSVEMWKYGRLLFQVDENRRPTFVAGVPPDAFSKDGQLWGNPLYDWEKMKEDGYAWWNERLKKNFALYDILRIDHFRGLDRYYAVPAGAKTASEGEWRDACKEELFSDKLHWEIVAEDLGVLDEGVYRLMKKVGYPGMKILQFAFDGVEKSEHKPSAYAENFICYTGTHDNMPLRGYIEALSEKARSVFLADLKKECEKAGVKPKMNGIAEICDSVIALGFVSKARGFILPVWDAFTFSAEARINLPATLSNKNWSFRFLPEDFSRRRAKWLYEQAKNGNRI